MLAALTANAAGSYNYTERAGIIGGAGSTFPPTNPATIANAFLALQPGTAQILGMVPSALAGTYYGDAQHCHGYVGVEGPFTFSRHAGVTNCITDNTIVSGTFDLICTLLTECAHCLGGERLAGTLSLIHI